jgi:hypothetical protein
MWDERIPNGMKVKDKIIPGQFFFEREKIRARLWECT